MLFPKNIALISLTSFCFLTMAAGAMAQDQGTQSASAARAAQSSPAATKPEDARSAVGATQAVITVHGLCGPGNDAAAKSAASCTRTITREEFESLIKALNPGGQALSETALQNFARTYAELLAMQVAARKAGVEQTPQFQQVLEVVTLRATADLYRLGLQEKFRNPSQDEIVAYYAQHQADFERVKLSRILIPRRSPAGGDAQEFDKKALEAINAARERAAKGDDPGKIQSDSYAALGLKNPPATEMGSYGRSALLEKESADVFALHAGEVTAVEVEPSSYVIYKVTGKDTLTVDQSRDEIARTIEQKKFKAAIQAATDSAPAEFNDQYFGPGMKSVPVVNVPLPSHPSK